MRGKFKYIAVLTVYLIVSFTLIYQLHTEMNLQKTDMTQSEEDCSGHIKGSSSINISSCLCPRADLSAFTSCSSYADDTILTIDTKHITFYKYAFLGETLLAALTLAAFYYFELAGTRKK